MIEVEVKARIDNIDEIKQKLNSLNAKFLKQETQMDKIFGNPIFLDSNNKIIEGGIVSRIRVVNDTKILEFKEIMRTSGGIEIESELSSIDDGIALLKKLGFEEAFTVSKVRETYSYNDFTICLDKVEKLGCFIEVEKKISSNEEKNKQKEECIKLLNLISPGCKIENRKYGDLMQEIINK